MLSEVFSGYLPQIILGAACMLSWIPIFKGTATLSDRNIIMLLGMALIGSILTKA